MSAVRCPQCKLPLTDEEAGSGFCSSCGLELPPTEAPEPKSKAAPAPTHDPTIPWLAAGVSLLIAVVAIAWGWTRHVGSAEVDAGGASARLARLEADLDAHRTRELEHLEKIHALEARQPEVAPDKEPGPGDSAALVAKVELADKNAKEAEAKLAKATTDLERLHLEVKQLRDALAGKGNATQPALIREIRNGPNERTLLLNSPNGDYTVDRVAGGSKVKILGTIRKLIVPGIDGGSHLDALVLKAQEIHVTGPIAGNSTFKLVSEGAVVDMGRIDGNSDVLVRVLGGKISIGEVVGDSKVTLVAKEFALKKFADGGRTSITVTLNRDGHMSFGELRGNSKLVVQKYDRGDPDVKVDAGKVGPSATFKKLAF